MIKLGKINNKRGNTMKRIIFTILAIFLMSGVAMAEPARIHCPEPFPAQTIGASSAAIDVTVIELDRNEGYFSVQATFTGTGTLLLQYQISNNGTDFSTAVDIKAGAATSIVYPFPATGVNIFAKYIKVIASETGTANPVVITGAWLCIQ